MAVMHYLLEREAMLPVFQMNVLLSTLKMMAGSSFVWEGGGELFYYAFCI
jgi:hypothetical protein